MRKISVVIPSRLQIGPLGDPSAQHVYGHEPDGSFMPDRIIVDRELYLARAVRSVLHQSVIADYEWEIIVVVDRGMLANVPARFGDLPPGVSQRFVEAHAVGQSAAVNAGVAASTGDVLAFLEDDDCWAREKMEVQRPLLDRYDFVSSNQREVDEGGTFVRVNDFPTPSGWVMNRGTWHGVGPMDESFRFHVDSEWLGRLNTSPYRRIHVVEQLHEPPVRYSSRPRDGNWLSRVAEHSAIQWSPHSDPLVTRVVNPQGGTSQIASDPKAAAQSDKEHRILQARFGMRPW